MDTEATVYVVDDDPAVRESLKYLIKSAGFQAEVFPTAQAFLDADVPRTPGCVVIDVRMPGMGGLELQERLRKEPLSHPVIIITGHGDIPMAVRAVRGGALEFIEKPFDDWNLLEAVRRAIDLDRQTRGERERRSIVLRRAEKLTPREREVMNLVVAGKPNKGIAAELGISQKTVEIHRANAVRKMQADSVADLVRMADMVKRHEADPLS